MELEGEEMQVFLPRPALVWFLAVSPLPVLLHFVKKKKNSSANCVANGLTGIVHSLLHKALLSDLSLIHHPSTLKNLESTIA